MFWICFNISSYYLGINQSSSISKQGLVTFHYHTYNIILFDRKEIIKPSQIIVSLVYILIFGEIIGNMFDFCDLLNVLC